MELPPEQEQLFDLQEYVDRLYEASDKAAHIILNKIADHDPYGPLGDPRSIAREGEW